MKTVLALLLALVGYASAALMAIDLGSEFLKVGEIDAMASILCNFPGWSRPAFALLTAPFPSNV